ncbi:hypothetical protein ANN_04911 [Periplaneta americana]|uniref:GIY-YIG domain-containing protein n=1 Tax=Periplaneta americana TaxID=6978 RepID=A0ABQ8TAI0_PERAM|nr:hypothetical protein ANN_04911 [Periplaneta americana]
MRGGPPASGLGEGLTTHHRDFGGGRPVGRPRNRWEDDVCRDALEILKIRNWRVAAQDRQVWWSANWGGHDPKTGRRAIEEEEADLLFTILKLKSGLKEGIYKIPCECGEVYIGQTGRTIEDRIKEHKRNLRLYYPEKSAVAQHSIEKEHKILFDHTKVINKSSHYWDRTIKEAIEIKLEKNNFNRDSGLQLSQAWTPALDQLRPSYNQGHEDHGPRTATDFNRWNRARRPPNFTQESREGRSLRAKLAIRQPIPFHLRQPNIYITFRLSVRTSLP